MTSTDITPSLREAALKRLKQRRDFYAHLLLYAMVNGFLVVLWYLTASPGFFWPMFPIFGWGVGLVMHAWDVFWSTGFTDEEIDREIARMRQH